MKPRKAFWDRAPSDGLSGSQKAFLGSVRHDILLENKPRALQMLTAYTLVAINIISIFICYDIAKNRRGNTRFWGLMGVFFGPVAIPFALFCKPKKQE